MTLLLHQQDQGDVVNYATPRTEVRTRHELGLIELGTGPRTPQELLDELRNAGIMISPTAQEMIENHVVPAKHRVDMSLERHESNGIYTGTNRTIGTILAHGINRGLHLCTNEVAPRTLLQFRERLVRYSYLHDELTMFAMEPIRLRTGIPHVFAVRKVQSVDRWETARQMMMGEKIRGISLHLIGEPCYLQGSAEHISSWIFLGA